MTAKRSLRLSVPDDMYREIEKYARLLNLPVAKCAAILMSFGVGALEAHADREAAKREVG
jgi:hypothetical protein